MKKKILALILVLLIAVVIFYYKTSSQFHLVGSSTSNVNISVSKESTSSSSSTEEPNEKVFEFKKKIKIVLGEEQNNEGVSKLEKLMANLSEEKKKFFLGIMPFVGSLPVEVNPLSFYKDLKNHPHVFCIEEGAGRFAYVMDLKANKTFFYDWKAQKIIFFAEDINRKDVSDEIKFDSKIFREDLMANYRFEANISTSSFFGEGKFHYIVENGKQKEWPFECEFIE